MQYSKNAMKTIYMSFGLSLLYNLVGLSFAITGALDPIVAAIIMPLSTITIVSFVTILTNVFAKAK
jgi:Cu+-exporting ATPase